MARDAILKVLNQERRALNKQLKKLDRIISLRGGTTRTQRRRPARRGGRKTKGGPRGQASAHVVDEKAKKTNTKKIGRKNTGAGADKELTAAELKQQLRSNRSE